MESETYKSVGLKEGMRQLPSLHKRVVNTRARVEIVGDSPEAAVLISKVELDSLERALEILATTPGVSQVRRQVRQILQRDRGMAGLAMSLSSWDSAVGAPAIAADESSGKRASAS